LLDRHVVILHNAKCQFKKSFMFLEDPSPYKMSWCFVNLQQFPSHLRSSHTCHVCIIFGTKPNCIKLEWPQWRQVS